MNLVRQSLYLCISVLLLIIGLLGAQSVWNVAEVSRSAEAVAAASRLTAVSEGLWNGFTEAEQSLRSIVSYQNVEGMETALGALARDLARMDQDLVELTHMAEPMDPALRQEVAQVVTKAQTWKQLAQPYSSASPVTELPAAHQLDGARQALRQAIDTLVTNSGQRVASASDASQALARRVQLWAGIEVMTALVIGLLLGRHALRSLRQQIGGDASELARITSAVADGDLSVVINTHDITPASAMAATARMQQALTDVVVRVRGISESLATGVGQIAAGNSDLSARTEQQAEALVRTAATMHQLDQTVRHNAGNASQASALASQASEVAQRGGNVVGQVVSTMRGIEDSSRKIEAIIGVIDSIAFQTNILALNAAVEAARAGDQGRGFAVVASEVRNLAQRSATAAREIKTLIADSVTRVGEGTALVDVAGNTMDEVVRSIRQVSEVMTEIRSASAEQSSGVADVGKAVAEMDHATQQNAALAEESAAAAESLRQQAQALVEVVSFFRLHGHAV
ncbi:MAG: hypothetical protein RLZZ592_908 [Pseudomonadota bacterium]|jgi:methyl-accepting chemotaxis protein